MSLLETGQPESLRREDVLNMLRNLGLDPDWITTEGVRITGQSIECVMFVRGPDGKWVDDGNHGLLKNRIHIPLTDD